MSFRAMLSKYRKKEEKRASVEATKVATPIASPAATPDMIAEFVWRGLAPAEKHALIASHITKTLGA